MFQADKKQPTQSTLAEEWAKKVHKEVLHADIFPSDLEHERACADCGVCCQEFHHCWDTLINIANQLHAHGKSQPAKNMDACKCLWLLHGRRGSELSEDHADDIATLMLVVLQQKKPYRLVFQLLDVNDHDLAAWARNPDFPAKCTFKRAVHEKSRKRILCMQLDVHISAVFADEHFQEGRAQLDAHIDKRGDVRVPAAVVR
eukprot:9424075-Pyramimonas_sp.AAC.1